MMILCPLMSLVLLHALWLSAHAAHSQKRVAMRTRVVHVYDRSITTFDPQGRLLQVEYGLEAANRGSPIVALLVNETIYVGVVSSSASGAAKTKTHTTSSVLPLHRLDDHLFLVATGLAGDALALAAELRLGAVRHRLGQGEAMTVREAATAAADGQHALTRKGGSRPLGVTALILGLDHDNDNGGPRLYRCHPGGTLENCWYATAGQNQRIAMQKLEQVYPSLAQAPPEETVRALLHTLKAAVDGRREKPLLDVWIIRPKKSSGGTSVSCIQGLSSSVSKKELQETLDKLPTD